MIIAPAEFRRIVQEVLGIEPDDHFTDRQCPDDYIPFAGYTGGPTDLDGNDRARAEERPRDRPGVILVLESPHRSEFPPQGGRVGPALGPTGRRIQQYLGSILRQSHLWSQVQHCSGLILFNAIPFQCSLGQSTHLHRDRVFREVWERGGRADFVSRLRACLVDGDLVLNACTRGTGIPSLCGLVELAIKEAFNGPKNPSGKPSDLRLNHPYSWTKEEHRKPLAPIL